MLLTAIFDDLTDPVMIISQDGDLSYANSAAKLLIHGETVDTLGIGPLQRVFKQLQYDELKLPFSFEFTVASYERYQVKINHLYSAYAVHCKRVENVASTQSLMQSIVHMLHDYLLEPLEQVESAMEMVLAELTEKQHVNSKDKANINNMIQQSRRMSARISHLESLGELYFDDCLSDYELIAASRLLQKISHHPETREELTGRIFLQSESEDSIYCNVSWLLSALTSCVRQLLKEASEEQFVLIQHSTNNYFHQISMTLREQADDVAISPVMDNEPAMYRDYEITEVMELNLLIAVRVIDLHGGQLKFNSGSNGGLLLEIPINGQKLNEDMQIQAKLYAQDLAEIVAQIAV